ncbi:ABC transporter ATP-binding protein [Natrarchaeobius chitinivorans]|uniref:ATP-binding cassette domain-containing protein n=1 Tax=Natrarchaeobius chitinivorans TaxID=1679083 RepID=A0A3N6LXG1_NATCH|nr:oligopeptide/dipeptide ABC transporter ATP-binding protein [Natrarchaeobius chitinivorans]RQG95463.1 ATP-binding cassette domain-containing protein [Natrarchaeobius chitinivorans]
MNSTIAENELDGDTVLKAENVKKHFPADDSIVDKILGRSNSVHAVNGVSLSLQRNEIVGVVGESGCGKSTLGRTLSRLYEPTSGSIFFNGKDISSLSRKEEKKLRKEIQFIFQDPHSSLNPRRKIGELIGQPLEVHGIATGSEKREQVKQLLREVGLDPGQIDRYPHEFSGGQRQRIGIARALAVKPKLIIADEPVSALDVSVQAQIINLLKRIQDDHGFSMIFIAHDLRVVKHISDRVFVMYLGEIMEKAQTDDLYDNPQHPYTRALLEAIPNIDSESNREDTILTGDPPDPIDPPSGCPFHTRCPEYIGDICENEKPPLEGATDHAVSCHWKDRSTKERLEHAPPGGTD